MLPCYGPRVRRLPGWAKSFGAGQGMLVVWEQHVGIALSHFIDKYTEAKKL